MKNSRSSTCCTHRTHRVGLSFILLFFCILMNVSFAFAQQTQTVTGTVVDETGEPMVGVSVAIKNTGTGTTTNIDGFYTLNVLNNATLTFTYLSYRTIEVSVAGKTKIDVKMEEDLQLLDEVVVVGYGTQRKKDLTGSVTSVKADGFNKGAVNANPLQLVEGKVAGLTITRVNGNDPNAGLAVQLRGVSSANGAQSPLVIVDGVPGGDLNTISPQDIESIDVLKDGSAAAIYGTRGTNGVILVTTKKGKGGKARVDFEAMIFTETIEKKLESLTGDQYWQVSVDRNKDIMDKGYNTNWFDAMIKTPLSQMYNLSISGGSEDLTYRASVSYKDQDGIASVPTNRETLNGRLSLTQTSWNGRLKFDTNLAYSNIKSKFTSYSAFEQAVIRNPTYPIYNEDGSFCYSENPSEFDFNPVAYLYNINNRAEYNRIMADLRASVEIIKDLKISAMGALRKDLDLSYYYDPSTSEFNSKSGVPGQPSVRGIAQRGSSSYTAQTIETTADYFKQVEKHKFFLMGGYSYQDFMSESFNAKNQNFSSDVFLWNNLSNGTYLKEGKAEMGSDKSSYKLIAFLARINYNYDEKYLLTASIRREGSSRFGTNYKWGNFPAISAGWRISNESFMRGINWLSDLKIRAGYGLTGNQMNENYISIARMGQQQYVLHNGEWIRSYGPSTNPNANLKWEVKHEANFGFDASFLKDRMGMTFDIYSRKNTDLLYQIQATVPGLIHDQVWANVGDMKSNGVELTFSGVPIMQKDLVWNISANISHNKSRLVSFGGNSAAKYQEFGYLGAPGILGNTIRLEEGGEVGNFFGFKYLGLTENGKWIFEDVDDNGIYNDADKQIIGNGVPKYMAGLTTNLTYKRFELTMALRGAFGFDVLNTKEIYYGNQTTFPANNLLTSALTKHKNLNDIPLYSSYYLEKGDYLKISNLTLAYNFDTKKFSKFVSALRLYTSADNLYTFTKYSGIDPEVSSNGFTTGIDGKSFYPRTRTFTFGINLSF